MHWLRFLKIFMVDLVKRPPVPERDEVDPEDVPLGLEPEPVAELALVSRLPPVTIGEDGWARGEGVVVLKTKRPGYRWRTLTGDPGGFLWHWTSTGWGTGDNMVERRIEEEKDEDGGGGTVHFWIDYDPKTDKATIYQSCTTEKGHGHAGGKSSARLRQKELGGGDHRIVRDPKSRWNANYLLLGCEMVNVGELRWMRPGATPRDAWVKASKGQAGAVLMSWPYGRLDEKGKVEEGTVVPEMYATPHNGKIYHCWPLAQVDAAERLIRAVMGRYDLSPEDCSWGHCLVDPKRKSDPGPLWLEVVLPGILQRIKEYP